MLTIGYIGDYLDQEVQEEMVEVGKVNMKSFDEKTVTRIIHAVTTAVLMGLSEAAEGLKVKEKIEERAGAGLSWSAVMLIMLMMSVVAVSMM